MARGLLVTSESGRVVSFLKVESLPQVMVGIRVLEVDRTKARRLGVDLRADRKNVSVANYTIPGGEGLPDLRGKVTELAGTGRQEQSAPCSAGVAFNESLTRVGD